MLCVICILAILASLVLPAVARAYGRARGFAEEFEAPEIASMLCHETRNYCAANPTFDTRLIIRVKTLEVPGFRGMSPIRSSLHSPLG